MSQARSRARAGSNTSGLELQSRGRTGHMGDFAISPSATPPPGRYFEPTAATASMFLYAQGNSVVCCHHDTLTIERRFARHSEEVQLLAVDNVSDVGAGRLVVSYDAGQTAIVWDLLTGDEVARFASYENLTCAAWMRNGNVAFGNIQGNIILFEPTTSEHISARTIDQISITAIAPAADCRTFAIGYQNGSMLIATLQPRFTILHNLSTSRGPSPIVTLAWHASSSRQKSDMLAVQTNDGDLRVWSVSKAYNSDDPAKVVRLLKRTENYLTGPNWMGWSKNGRILQFSEGETISWDVRTKHVTYDTIPTLDTVRGVALYGPGASLFTLGAQNTVQQFDLNAPAMLVANVQHPANLLPPSPPISLEAEDKGANASQSDAESTVPIGIAETSEDEEGSAMMSPLARLVKGEKGSDAAGYRSRGPPSVTSSRSQSSVSISSSSSHTPARGYAPSVVSRAMTENTYISAGSSVSRSSVAQYRDRQEMSQRDIQRDSFSTTSSISMTSASGYRSRHRPSRLRNEVPRSPEESRVLDLFKFTKSRLTDVPFKAPFTGNDHLTNDDLRRQMLSTIFGWNKEAEDLVRDELSRHPLGSTNRILLAKWLGDINTDIMAMGSENMTSSDWMLLALSGIGGQASQHKLGRAYVQRLLENGDVHAAATIMIGLGDHNDAIEIYVSHKQYMEALILTCLFFPAVWERQEAIIRKWGEWAVQHGQQQLAIRCFSCTGRESAEPWTSPSAQQITFQSMTHTSPELLSPPMSPPSLTHGPQRSVAKASALKLITSFDQTGKNRLFNGIDDGKTPMAVGNTPIESAAGDPATAVLRNPRSQIATPVSARPIAGFGRNRLPSIGEAPNDHHRELLTAVATKPSLELRPDAAPRAVQALEGLRPHTSSPRLVKDKQPPPSPSPAAMANLMEGPKRRNGSRSRVPEALNLTNQEVQGDLTSPEHSAASSVRYHWPSRRRGPASVASSVTSAASSVASRSHRPRRKNLDDYINSGLDSAKLSQRGASRESRGRVRDSSRGIDEERGRNESRGFTPKGGKRSPKSPVPMSPEDLINLATPKDEDEFFPHSRNEDQAGQLIDISFGEPDAPGTVRKAMMSRDASTARASSRATSRGPRSRDPSRDGRGQSPGGKQKPPALDLRGRSAYRSASVNRSPSSPQPMPVSANAPHNYGSDDEEDYRAAVEAREKFRQRKGRSSSRTGRSDGLMSPQSSRSNTFSRAELGGKKKPGTPGPAPQSAGMSDRYERQAKKDAAARELEERRKSLALRDTAPVPHPDEFSPALHTGGSSRATPPAALDLSGGHYQWRKEDLPSRSASTDPIQSRSMYATRDGPRMGLPATPKAMRLVLESDSSKHGVPVPAVPAAYASQVSASPPMVQQSQSSRSSPRKMVVEPEPEPEAAPAAPEPLTLLLPSTVYTPPPPSSRHTPAPPPIQRSMSAPPRDLAPPSGAVLGRNMFVKPSLPTVAQGSASQGRRPSRDQLVPPPPPPAPAPPMLKELQHLAKPPPPPPAPLQHANGPKPVVYGGSTGVIEILMGDEQQQAQQAQQYPMPMQQAPIPVAIPVSEATVPVIAPPVPTSSRNGHRRGRSSIDNSIGARLTRATDRMRSASRSRTSTRDPSVGRIKSPDLPAPYESVPPPMPNQGGLTYQMRAEMANRPPMPMIPQPGQRTTGLHHSEMI